QRHLARAPAAGREPLVAAAAGSAAAEQVAVLARQPALQLGEIFRALFVIAVGAEVAADPQQIGIGLDVLRVVDPTMLCGEAPRLWVRRANRPVAHRPVVVLDRL